MRYAVAILLTLTMPAIAADTTSANYFLPGCKGFVDESATVSELKKGVCVGFVMGVGVVSASLSIACLPEGVTNKQAVVVAIKYVEARPERMHEHFGTLVLEALTAAWPCKR
jgi:hypothetical protein